MKAILVIDVPVTDIGKEFVYRRHNGTEWVDAGKYKFMLMPKRNPISEEEMDDETKGFALAFNQGWNNCLDEIEGK